MPPLRPSVIFNPASLDVLDITTMCLECYSVSSCRQVSCRHHGALDIGDLEDHTAHVAFMNEEPNILLAKIVHAECHLLPCACHPPWHIAHVEVTVPPALELSLATATTDFVSASFISYWGPWHAVYQHHSGSSRQLISFLVPSLEDRIVVFLSIPPSCGAFCVGSNPWPLHCAPPSPESARTPNLFLAPF